MLVARDLHVTVDERMVPDLQATVVRVHGRRESIEWDRPPFGTSQRGYDEAAAMEERHERDERGKARWFREPSIELREPHDLDLEEIMVMFVNGRASCPQRSVLADDVLADLELGREAEILHVTVRLGRV
jgi:hypothetical protein